MTKSIERYVTPMLPCEPCEFIHALQAVSLRFAFAAANAIMTYVYVCVYMYYDIKTLKTPLS